MINRHRDGRYTEAGVQIGNFGISYCQRLNIQGQPRQVPGTYAYQSPEILLNGEAALSTSSDVWAIGCIGYELCVGGGLAGNQRLLPEHELHIRNGGQDPQTLEVLIATIPATFGQVVRNALRACLAWNPNMRCSAAELRDYISQPNWGG